MRRLVTLLGVLVAAGTLVVPAASAALPHLGAAGTRAAADDPGQITVRLLDASVARRDDPRARIYIDDHVAPGTTVIRHVEVSSSAKRPVAVNFYADAASVADGAFLPAQGRGVNDLTSWTVVSPRSATLPPGGRVVLTVTINVPHGVRSGERYGVILADVPPAPTRAGSGIAVGARVGVRVYLSVGSGAEPVTDFAVSTLTASRTASGQPKVAAQVTNTGGRAVDLWGTLTLDRGPGGLRAGPFTVTVGTTLGVGQSAPVTVLLDPKLPDGPWHAVLTMHSGPVTRAVEGTIVFPSGAGQASAPVKAKAVPLSQRKDVVAPVAGVLLGGLAFALLLFLLWRRRDRDDRDKGSGPPAPRVPSARSAAERDAALTS